jgi:LuxR family maltose regulon positive regulatory protein
MTSGGIPTLIQTKLHLPPVSSDLVKRPSLIQQLNQNLNRNFTLVSSPAGFGKTTLVASWLTKQQFPYAWISLDKLDNNLSVFLQYVAAAIQHVFPEACMGLSRTLQVPDLPTDDTLAAIVINELNQLPQPILLVLDDYHVIHNSSILQLVERILGQSQNRLHLVIISRMDPLLPLPRLRLQQGMVEIRQEDLRFSDEEAGLFLRTAVTEPVAPETITRLNQRLEGWVAGLRLLSLSMQNSEQAQKFSLESQAGAREHITHYLFTEVLAQQTPEVQQFLLQTAFVNRFCASLGDALMAFAPEHSAAQRIIAHLRRANLFIISLDEEGNWFRYHHLFQQMLQQKATAQFDKAAMNTLHNRAGAWLAQNGFVDEALQHYLSAGNMDTAVSLIETNSRDLLNSLERQRLERWLEMLPEEIIWERPRLLVAKAWLFYRHWRLQALAIVLIRLQVCLEAEPVALERGEKEFILGQLQVLSSVTAFYLDDDFAKSITSAEQALSLLPQSEQGALGTALGYLALSLQAEGQLATAVSRLQQALANPAPLGPAQIQLYLSLSFVHLASGNLLALKQIIDQFMAMSQKMQLRMAPACWVSGIYYYELNQLDKAQQAFETTVSLHYDTNFIAACDSWLALTRICQEQGDFVQAQTYLDAVQAETLRLDNRELLPVIEAVQAYQWHMQGKSAVALRWARAFDPHDSPEWVFLTFIPLLFWVRILAAHGDSHELQELQQILQTKLTIAQSRYFTQRAIQLLAHLALVQTKLGHEDHARSTLEKAVRLAEPGGFMRAFIDCGPALRPFFEQLQQQAVAPHYLAQLMTVYSANGQNKLHGTFHPQTRSDMATLLTNREMEILQLMQTGLSNKEIAQALVISVYTVKRHASNIYLKLEVNGRRQAIYKAQQAGILSPN